jgi:hypothetical protein
MFKNMPKVVTGNFIKITKLKTSIEVVPLVVDGISHNNLLKIILSAPPGLSCSSHNKLESSIENIPDDNEYDVIYNVNN